MSWGVQLSTISSNAICWASAAMLDYHSDYVGQLQLPTWLADEEPVDFIDIVGPEWKLLNQAIRKSFNKTDVIQVRESLWLFSADAAKQVGGLMPFIEAKTKRQIAAALAERIARFISSLGPETLGVVRLAEWGKY